MKTKIDLMHQVFGEVPGDTCTLCENLVRFRDGDVIIKKCTAYGVTPDEETDWQNKWAACGLKDKKYPYKAAVLFIQRAGKLDLLVRKEDKKRKAAQLGLY